MASPVRNDRGPCTKLRKPPAKASRMVMCRRPPSQRATAGSLSVTSPGASDAGGLARVIELLRFFRQEPVHRLHLVDVLLGVVAEDQRRVSALEAVGLGADDVEDEAR